MLPIRRLPIQNLTGITEIVDVVNLEALDARLYHEPRQTEMVNMRIMVMDMTMRNSLRITIEEEDDIDHGQEDKVNKYLLLQSDGQFNILPNELDLPAQL